MISKWIVALTVMAILAIACSAGTSSSLSCSADKALPSCFGDSPNCNVVVACTDTDTSFTLNCTSSGCTCNTSRPDGGKGQDKKVPFQSSFCATDCVQAANRACLWGID